MKKILNLVETGETGFEELLGEEVTFFCMNYIYAGKLVGVNATHVQIENPKIVYETGDFKSAAWKDVQALPSSLNIMLSSIESFGKVK